VSQIYIYLIFLYHAKELNVYLILTLFISYIVTKFLIENTNICTYNIHDNDNIFLLLHVLAEIGHFRESGHPYMKQPKDSTSQ
jgi:hypothetical protein